MLCVSQSGESPTIQLNKCFVKKTYFLRIKTRSYDMEIYPKVPNSLENPQTLNNPGVLRPHSHWRGSVHLERDWIQIAFS